MKKALPSLGRWLVNLFLVLALLLAAAVWLPEAFHMRAYVVKSSSMEPAIRVGSIIYLRPYREDEPVCPGDIVSFPAGGAMVTHRIVSVNQEEKTAVSYGYANKLCDPDTVPLSAIEGKVEFHLPLVGYLLLRK